MVNLIIFGLSKNNTLPITPISEVLVCVEKTMQEEIITEGGLSLYKDSSFRPQFSVTTNGIVAAASPKIKGVDKGDEIVFGYDVIMDRVYKSDAHCFLPETEGNNYLKKFRNGKGEILQVAAVPLAISNTWVGAYIDASGEFVDGVQGTESVVERWMAQFEFGSPDEFIFKNLLEIDNVDYWRCSEDKLLAKKVGGDILPIGDSRLILKPIVINLKHKLEIMKGKPLPFQKVSFTPDDRGVLIHDYEPLGLKKDDIIGFQKEYCEKYELFGGDYFLIKPKRAICKWQIEA